MKVLFWQTLILMILPVVAACSSRPNAISGQVRDRNGPVAGAIVRVQTSDLYATTDANGDYVLAGLPADDPVTLTAWAPGYYIVGGETEYVPGSRGVQLVLVPHSEVDNPEYDWLSAFNSEGNPNNCQNCHSQVGNPMSALPFDEWRRDAHSNSASSERFVTMYTGTDVSGNRSPLTRRGFNRDYGTFPLPPDLTRPYYGPGYKLDYPETVGYCAACHVPAAAIDSPYSVDPSSVTGVGAEGVTCDFCHKIWDVVLDDTGLPFPNMPGVLSYQFRRPPAGLQFFAGPFDDVAPGEDIFSPLQQQSQFCAPCHYGVFWENSIYNSFGEWLESPYSDPRNGQTCQDCHMPTGLTDRFARLEEGGRIRDPGRIFSHLMPGASDQNLLRHAVSMSVDARRDGGEIVLEVEIFNDRAGHHIPTGSPLRHMILLAQGFDSEGNRLVQLGGPTVPEWGGEGDPSRGHYAGLPGTAYAKVLQEIWTGIYPSGAYWNPTRTLSDNRIPAFGTDRTTYRFSATGGGEVTLDIRLIFRRAFIELIDLKGWDTPDILVAREMIVLQ